MFESTLEAQGLSVGERRLGTLSAAALAHLGFGLAIVVATALVVPPVRPPEPPPEIRVIVLPPKAEPTPSPAPTPPPKKGTDNPGPERALTPPPEVPETPPETTPDALPDPSTERAPDPGDGSGEGPRGDPNGSRDGVPGSNGDGDMGNGDGSGSSGPVTITADMEPPALVQKVAPNYPEVARKARMGGRVFIQAVIAPDGSVESAEVLSSTSRLFDDAALEAVREWRYRPAMMNGKPVRVFFTVRVDFVIR